jgi:integrase
MTFGTYPETSLKDARAMCDEARRVLRSGRNPAAEKKAGRLSAGAGDRSFEYVAREWHARKAPVWDPLHARKVLLSLEADVFPVLGAMDIGAITAPNVIDCLRVIEARSAVETAHRIRQRISAVFQSAIAAGIGESDPAAMVKAALTSAPRGKQPAIIDLPELAAMLRKAEDERCYPVTKGALRFIALTAARPGMVRGALWDEIEGMDGNQPLWHLSGERMKTGREYFTPLSGSAVDVLRALKPLTGRGPLIFPSARHAHRSLSENGVGYLLNRAGYHGRHCAHGFRAAFSSIMNQRHPADHDAIEAQLAHVVPGVRGAYLRAPFKERRAELLAEWDSLLMAGAKDARSLLLGPRH